VLEDEHDMEDMDEDEMEGMEERSEEEEEFVLDERVLFQVTVRNVYRYLCICFHALCVCVRVCKRTLKLCTVPPIFSWKRLYEL
jgi:hypothetical protein